MAKPKNRPYLIVAEQPDGECYGVSPNSFVGDNIKMRGWPTWDDKRGRAVPKEEGIVFFGLASAEKAINSLQRVERRSAPRKERAKYYLQKMTMSEFMASPQWDKFKNDSRVKCAYEKYLLMDLLREKGYQMS